VVGTFFPVGGPKAHGTLSITVVLVPPCVITASPDALNPRPNLRLMSSYSGAEVAKSRVPYHFHFLWLPWKFTGPRVLEICGQPALECEAAARAWFASVAAPVVNGGTCATVVQDADLRFVHPITITFCLTSAIAYARLHWSVDDDQRETGGNQPPKPECPSESAT